MLGSRLALHDVMDVEAFCVRIVDRSSLELRHHDREDLVAYLIETCWELSRRYERGGVRFSTVAGTILRQRLVDWQRSQNGRTRWQFRGRTYERQLPTVVPLDDRPDGPDHSVEMDAGSGGFQIVLGLDRTRDRDRAR